MMPMNLWLLLALMSLSTYRLTRLVVKDDFPPVLWLRDRIVGGWRSPTLKETYHENYPKGQLEEGAYRAVPGLRGLYSLVDGEIQVFMPKSKRSPFWLADLLSCPFCASGWIALAVTVGTWATVGLSVPVLCWFSAWAIGGAIAAQEWA